MSYTLSDAQYTDLMAKIGAVEDIAATFQQDPLINPLQAELDATKAELNTANALVAHLQAHIAAAVKDAEALQKDLKD